MVGLYENRQAVGFATDPQLHSNRTVIHYKREYLVQLYYTRGFAAGKPVPASHRGKFLLYPYRPAPHPSAGRADPFVPGGRLTAYRLALSVKGCGYGPGSRTLSPARSTPGATTPDVVPPTPPGPALPAPGESMSYKVPARPEAKSALQGRGTGLARWWGHEVLKGPNP